MSLSESLWRHVSTLCFRSRACACFLAAADILSVIDSVWNVDSQCGGAAVVIGGIAVAIFMRVKGR